QRAFRLAGQLLVARIADCDEHVSDKPSATGAFDCGLRKKCTELWIVETGEIGQTRRAQGTARSELGFPPLARKLVPWTDGKTIIAAINPVAHRSPQFARDRTFVLDGEIGNAASRIEPIRRRKCRGRANIQARAATSAAISHRCVRNQVNRRENRAEEQPRSVF